MIKPIVALHHNYVRKRAPTLLAEGECLCRHHGEAHPELWLILSELKVVLVAMDIHMNQEEQVLFPAIAELARKRATTDWGGWLLF